MPFRWDLKQHVQLVQHLLKWLVLAIPTAAVIGTAVAAFLAILDAATVTRWDHPYLLLIPPIGQKQELFRRRHGDLLKDKVIVYRYLEPWAITEAELVISATREDFASGED